MTPSQTKVLANLDKVDGFNEMNPDTVAGVLEDNLDLWEGGIFNPDEDDTLYLYPVPGKEDALELMVWRHFNADEIDYMPLYDYGRGRLGDNPIIATGGLRIWWD